MVAAVALTLIVGVPVTRPSDTRGTTYFVDCMEGDNRATGTTEETAWQTPWSYRDAGRVLSRGDRLLLKRGCTWGGQETRIVAQGASAQATITVGAYGDPAATAPTLTNRAGTTSCRDDCGPMDWDPTVLMRIVGSHVVIDGLRFVGVPDRIDAMCSAQPVGNHVGVWFEGTPGSLAVGDRMTNSEVTGLSRGAVVSASATRTRIHANRFVANTMMLTLDREPGSDGGAVGVQLQGSRNEVDHNEFRGHDGCSYDYGRDGSAIEVWGGAASENDVHHNTAFDNESFIELGKPEPAAPPTGNRIAFNVVIGVDAEGEGQAFLTTRGQHSSFGPVYGTIAVHNSVYLPGRRARGVVCDSGCDARILSLANNIIWSDGDGREPGYGTINCDEPCYERHDLVWSSDGIPVVSIAGDRDPGTAIHWDSLVADPRWMDPAGGDLRLGSMSPAIDSGEPVAIALGYGVDHGGRRIAAGGGFDMGAFESGD